MRKNSLILALAALTCAALISRAQDTAAPGPAPVPAAAVAASNPIPVEVKEENLRDPFWPPNYTKKSKIPEAPPGATNPPPVGATNTTSAGVTNPPPPPPPPVEIKWPEIKVKAIIKQPNGKYLMMIDGIKGSFEEGNIVSMHRDNLLFRWKVEAITAKGAKVTKLDYKPAKRP